MWIYLNIFNISAYLVVTKMVRLQIACKLKMSLCN